MPLRKNNIVANKVYCPPIHPKMSWSTPLQPPSTVFRGIFHFQTRPNHFFGLNQLISFDFPFFLMLSWYFNFKMKKISIN